jgi:effector-binding domain-containing protein
VSVPVSPSRRVKSGERPVIRVVQTVYHGSYEGLPAALGEFHEWIEQSGLKWAPNIWECYVVTPDSEPKPSKWQTELNRVLLN